MANGYASNIPRENLPEEAPVLAENVCIICKRRAATHDGTCSTCAKALSG